MRTEGLSIVVINWNGRGLLDKFFPTVVEAARSFESSRGEPTEIIVADDASSDDSGSWLRAHWPQVRFESSSAQRGFAPTANRGFQASRFPMVYLVNNDVALAPATLAPLADDYEPVSCAAPDNAANFGAVF
jgi:GT2 family glycosyltransferase